MLDFIRVIHVNTNTKKHIVEVFPDFINKKSKVLMVRSGAFYAIFDEKTGLWSYDEYDVVRMVDDAIRKRVDELKLDFLDSDETTTIRAKLMESDSSGVWAKYKRYLRNRPDNYIQLDRTLIFDGDKPRREDYVTATLPYRLERMETPAFDRLVSTLYDPEEVEKIQWMIGSLVTNKSRVIQKFFVFFGGPGTGKSTILNIVKSLFPEHSVAFSVKELVGKNNRFSATPFINSPLVALDHEGSLSGIESNGVLNSIVSHDVMSVDVKFKNPLMVRVETMLLIATNLPVKITDSKSGILRRLISISPTGKRLARSEYDTLVSQIGFELGGIAYKARDVFLKLGPKYYEHYMPTDMLYRTNVMFNFVDDNLDLFVGSDYISLKQAWGLYKDFCDRTNITYKLPMYRFRDELKEYFDEFHSVIRVDGVQVRSVYKNFNLDKIYRTASKQVDTLPEWLTLDSTESRLDILLKEQPAQVANEEGNPPRRWDVVETHLEHIDTSKLHYVLPSPNMVVIDFDLKEADGSKSRSLNLIAAAGFPPTYAEFSKSGQGIHLHYIYDGDVTKLSRVYSPGIDVLLPKGKFSIRRQHSLSNDLDVATISGGLPIKEHSTLVSGRTLTTERGLRVMIARNLHKEIHAATKPSIDFINKILHDAYDSGMSYDVSDMKASVLAFAAQSTNNAEYCVELVLKMPFVSDKEDVLLEDKDKPIVFFDIEVYPNLCLVCWKYSGDDKSVTRMYNPTIEQVEDLVQKTRLIGYNNRRYDNHILYALMLGMTNEQVYNISSRIVSNDRSAYFREAYRLSYADIYDFAVKQQSLKAWMIELDIFHMELDIPWDEPLDKDLWGVVGDYCENDVIATEKVFDHLHEDFKARQIMSELSGLSVNSTTTNHMSKIIFGSNKHPQSEFVYPDLSKEFPGYTYTHGVSSYKGILVGEGGYVFSKPGVYENVLYMDIGSMHPTSTIVMNLFGRYTQKYSDMKTTRMYIKPGNLEAASKMFDGVLAPYLSDTDKTRGLSNALKLGLNRVYGLTAAKYENPFKDPRNVDNVVAKRGALFMVDLQTALLERGSNLIHIKTDSIKIADYKDGDIEFVVEFGRRYGYDFAVEDIFESLVIINDADLIGKSADSGEWEAVGARFSKPFVYKTLFSKEPIVFKDYVEIRAVKKGQMYIVFDDDKEIFIGSIGTFCPVVEGKGGKLVRRKKVENGGSKDYAVTGTKGYNWLPSAALDKDVSLVDLSYFRKTVDDAFKEIERVGDPRVLFGG